MAYDIHLEVFEGPLDLLLYLIRRDDLNIYDIPISQITAEYLEYLEMMKELNLDLASEFIVMAATLMQIKAKSMLPVETIEEDEGPDPRGELVAKLLEYQRYKKVAVALREKEMMEDGIYYRNAPIFSQEDYVYEASIFDLMGSFKTILNRLPANVKEILYEEIPIEQKIRIVLDLLALAKADRFGRKFLNFTDILKLEKSRMGVIVLFLAVLELIRLKQIVARQARHFGDIRIYLMETKEDAQGAPAEEASAGAAEDQTASTEIAQPEEEKLPESAEASNPPEEKPPNETDIEPTT